MDKLQAFHKFFSNKLYCMDRWYRQMMISDRCIPIKLCLISSTEIFYFYFYINIYIFWHHINFKWFCHADSIDFILENFKGFQVIEVHFKGSFIFVMVFSYTEYFSCLIKDCYNYVLQLYKLCGCILLYLR